MMNATTMNSKTKKAASAELPKDEFVRFLHRELSERLQKNPAYSMRAFARHIDLDQSLLTKVLQGKRRLSPNTVQKILSTLQADASVVDRIIQKTTERAGDFRVMEEEAFNLIKGWHHFAILELMKLASFVPDEDYVSRRLGLHIEVVREALTRLEEMGYIRRLEHEWQLLKPNNAWSSTTRTSEARRQLQKTLLEKSLNAIDEVNVDKRDHSSLTVAVPVNRLPEFKEKIQKMRRELGSHFQSQGQLDEVYQLTISFFPLTQGAES
jgi:DNA-binding MarR family transcriptional regulator